MSADNSSSELSDNGVAPRYFRSRNPNIHKRLSSDRLFTKLQIQGSIIWWSTFVGMFVLTPLRETLVDPVTDFSLWIFVALPLSLILGIVAFPVLRFVARLPEKPGSRYFAGCLVSYGTTFIAYSVSILIVLEHAVPVKDYDTGKITFLILLASTSACAIVPIGSSAYNMALRIDAEEQRVRDSIQFTQATLKKTYSHIHGATQGKLVVVANLISQIQDPSCLNHRDEALSILDGLLDNELRTSVEELQNLRGLTALRHRILETAFSLHVDPARITFSGSWSEFETNTSISVLPIDEVAMVAEELLANSLKHGKPSTLKFSCSIEPHIQASTPGPETLILTINVVNLIRNGSTRHQRTGTGLDTMSSLVNARGGSLLYTNDGGVWTSTAMWEIK